LILICSQASCPSINKWNLQREARLNMPSMSGSGEVIFRVFALRARKSTTTLNRGGFDFAFGISNMGAVFSEFVIFQRPVFR
jgi:hypothetical protein